MSDDEEYVRTYFPDAVPRSQNEWKTTAEFMRRVYTEEELSELLKREIITKMIEARGKLLGNYILESLRR